MMDAAQNSGQDSLDESSVRPNSVEDSLNESSARPNPTLVFFKHAVSILHFG